jgi:asparagine synthetase B (glutamine-hydrolysing)
VYTVETQRLQRDYVRHAQSLSRAGEEARELHEALDEARGRTAVLQQDVDTLKSLLEEARRERDVGTLRVCVFGGGGVSICVCVRVPAHLSGSMKEV